MTRGTIPRFDIYEELEVSRLASVEVIEAAYRSLVKTHHPDVARPTDFERIKRLNLAREWLRDPARRRRYDEAMGPAGAFARVSSPRPANGTAATPRPPARQGSTTSTQADPASPRRKSSATSFGVNTPEVRQFLSDLRALDGPRAQQIWEGRASAGSRGYTEARGRALAASKADRQSEWLFAREAASVIAWGKLGESTQTARVLDVVADVAGALTIRDLISRADFELLLLPWTWRGERLPAPASVPRPSVAAAVGPTQVRAGVSRRAIGAPAISMGRRAIGAPAISMGRRVMRIPAVSMPLLIVVVALIAVGAALAGLDRPQAAVAIDVPQLSSAPEPTQAVVAATSAPSATPSATTKPPAVVIDPARLRELSQGARQTIRALATAAAAGDVETAQTLLGTTAPDLRSSGLRSATFPEVAAADISVVNTGDQWIATAATDRLVSNDGATWTFDYADRPLARFASPAERNLYWIETDGRHDLHLRVASATVSRSGLVIRFAWRYGSGDAAHFEGAEIAISSITLGARSMPLVIEPASVIGPKGRNATTSIPGTVDIPPHILVQVTVTPGGAGGATSRPISTLFELAPG